MERSILLVSSFCLFPFFWFWYQGYCWGSMIAWQTHHAWQPFVCFYWIGLRESEERPGEKRSRGRKREPPASRLHYLWSVLSAGGDWRLEPGCWRYEHSAKCGPVQPLLLPLGFWVCLFYIINECFIKQSLAYANDLLSNSPPKLPSYPHTLTPFPRVLCFGARLLAILKEAQCSCLTSLKYWQYFLGDL